VLRFLQGLFGGRSARDDAPVKVILGLGNPGKEYERTRHNVGWWVVDHLADVWRFDGWKKDGQAHVASSTVAGARVRLVKPLTYMNVSGAVLRPYLRRANWNAASDLMVVVDEVAIPLGTYRFRARGSSGGHNGLKSIEGALSSQEYARLRVGIGPVPDRQRRKPLADYVLDEFGKAEAKVVTQMLPVYAEALELWIREGITPVMNRFTGKESVG
jgi:peptidyl-tRNA hydrolase, PTH1 family